MNNKLDKVENINERKVSFGEKISLKVRKNFITNKTKTFLLIIVIILAFMGINMYAQNKDLAQIDVTESKIYTLTQKSKDAIKNIQDEVNIYVYGYDENSPYVNFIKQYVAYNPNIKYEIVTETTHYDIVTTYNMGTYSDNEILVVANGKDVSMYPDYEFQTSEYVNDVIQYADVTEQSITNAIIKVTDKDPAKVYFVSGHGEFPNTEISMLLSLLDSSVYEYEFLNLLSASQIPNDCDILAILAPSNDYSATETEMIKNYINNGGNILLAMTTIGQESKFANLQSVLDQFAVSVEDGVLYEGTANNYASIQGIPIPIVVLPNYSSSSKITDSIEVLPIFSWAQSIAVDYTKTAEMNLSVQDLLTTSSKTYRVTDYANGFDSVEGLDANTYTIARKITKTIEVEGQESKTSNLVIVGNDTFLADSDSLIQASPMLYNEYVGNAEFVMNTLEDLAEKENTLVITKKIDSATFLPTAQESNIVQFIVFAVPVIIILAGIIVGVVRKRMR